MRTYDLMATPLVYPGQVVKARIVAPAANRGTVEARLRSVGLVKDLNGRLRRRGAAQALGLGNVAAHGLLYLLGRWRRRRDDLPPHVRDTTLPTLHGLLKDATAPPGGSPGAACAVALLARPPAIAAGRSRLLSSTGQIGVPPLRPPSLRRSDSG